MKGSEKELQATKQDRIDSSDIWSSYWKGPRLVCSLAGTGIGYPKPLVDIWQEYFETFDNDAKLLDIGTGNGAVAIIANDTAKSLCRRFEIHASDQSDIDPVTHLQGTGLSVDGITFHPNTPSESTGFPDNYFDGVTGQFALEYMDMPATIKEMARILKPGARARFIMHMQGSNIYEQTKRQLQDIEFVLDRMQLLKKAREMMAAADELEKYHSTDERLLVCAREARERYLEAARTVDRLVPDATYKEIFIAILKMVAYHWSIRHQSTLEQFTKRADEMGVEILMAQRRHEAMCEHALDSSEMETLREQFVHTGFSRSSFSTLQMTVSGIQGIVGWDLSARIQDRRHD